MTTREFTAQLSAELGNIAQLEKDTITSFCEWYIVTAANWQKHDTHEIAAKITGSFAMWPNCPEYRLLPEETAHGHLALFPFCSGTGVANFVGGCCRE